MQETIGTLDLKIARLQHQLNVLTLREAMSKNYPEHYRNFRKACQTIVKQIQHLNRQRQMLSLNQTGEAL